MLTILIFGLWFYFLLNTRDKPQTVFWKSWLVGWLFFLIQVQWITTIGHWSNLFWGLLAWLLLSAALGFFSGLSGLVSMKIFEHLKTPHFWIKAGIASIVFVFFEWLHSVGPWGLPFGQFSLVFTNLPFFLQTLSVWGIWIQELFLILVLLSVIKLAMDARAKQWQLNQNLILGGVLALILAGNFYLWQQKIPTTQSLRVAVVQPNTPQEHKLNSVYFLEIEDQVFKQTKSLLSAQKQPVDFVLWPETVVPRLLLNDPGFVQKLNELKTTVLFGTPHFDTNQKLFNLIAAYSNGGMQTYAKQHLVPFGEYLPLRHWLGWVSDPAFQFLDYSAGNSKQSLIAVRDQKLATLVCFESLFPSYAKAQFKRGAQALILITNDAWFLKTSGVAQHAQFLILRAIENRTYAIQLGNSGFTYLVNPRGQVVQKLPPFTSASAVWELPVRTLK